MHESIQHHLTRLKSATTNKVGRKDLADWITTNTYLSSGKRFSFKNHEFQRRIAEDTSREINVQKSAQLGVSELAMRMAVGMVMIMPTPFAAAYVFPTSGFSTQYSKARFSPIIQNSPLLRSSINSEDIDSAELKQFGLGRQLYFKGASSGTSAISTSLSAVYLDEYSYMDQVVAGDFTSRLIHDEHRIKIKFSTPTFLGDPISRSMEESKRWRNMCRCHHCQHVFYPEFYEHVKIEGFNKHLDEITAENLNKVNYKTAVIRCPHCGDAPSLQPEHRFWDCENPSDNHIATGYYLSPFDAPNIISTPYLIEASTGYANKAKFRQFNLGIPSEDSESGLTEADLDLIGVEMPSSPFNAHVMGIDLGIVSHFTVGGIGADGRLGIVHMERVPLTKFRERYFQIKAEFRVSITLSDCQPYTDLILSLSADDPNLFGGVYSSKQGLEIFEVKQREADPDNALRGLRQVAINRNAAFDQLLADIRGGKVWVRKTSEWDIFKKHLQDMRRASATLRNGEFTSLWQKSGKAVDHYHHSSNYLAVAAQMRGLISGHAMPNMGVRTFRLPDLSKPSAHRPILRV